MRPREKNGGGGKAGNRNDKEEVRSGWRRDPSTPGPETSAVASERGHKTEETAGGGEELETETEVGSMEEERDETHAIRPVEGQETSMPTEEPREATTDDGRMAPWRGEGKPTGMLWTRLIASAENLSFSLFGTYRWMCG